MDPVNLNRIFRILPYALDICPAEIIDLSVISWIIKDSHDEVICERLYFALADSAVSVVVQPDRNSIQCSVILYIPVKDQLHNFCLFRLYYQFLINTAVSIRSRSSRPSAVKNLLHLTSHELNIDVLTLDLCHGRQNCQRQLSARRRTVNGVFHTDQINLIIFQKLKGLQYVRRIPSEPGQLEHQNKRDIVLLAGYIIQHLQECRSSDYALAGFPCIAVFTGYFKILIVRILAEAFLLCLQAVPFRLSCRRDSRVDIAFLLSHRIPPFGCSSSHSTPRNFIMSGFDLSVSAKSAVRKKFANGAPVIPYHD